MQVLTVGDIARLDYDEEGPDADFMKGEFVEFVVMEADEYEVKGLVISGNEGHRPSPIAVLVTDSRFDQSVHRDGLFGDQRVWIFLPVSVELRDVTNPCVLERVGRVTPVVLEEIRRKITAVLLAEDEKGAEELWQEFDDVSNVVKCALDNLWAHRGRRKRTKRK